MDAFNEWLDVPSERVAVISNLVQMLHNASLLFVLSFAIASSMMLMRSGLVCAPGFAGSMTWRTTRS